MKVIALNSGEEVVQTCCRFLIIMLPLLLLLDGLLSRPFRMLQVIETFRRLFLVLGHISPLHVTIFPSAVSLFLILSKVNTS